MSNTFVYEFEELPLVIHEKIEGAFINGAAVIEYSHEGGWEVKSITVEGYGELIDGRRQYPQVPAPTWLSLQIIHRLENEWHDKVQDAVIDQLDDDHEAASEDQADMRRDFLKGMYPNRKQEE